MKTNKVYWNDSYLTQLETLVLDVRGNEIILQDSIIFSFSGGQESDLGYINEYKVLDSRFEKDVIVYVIEDNHNIKVNDNVFISIDWQYRYDIMKNHLAVELVNLILEEKYPNIVKVGANVAQKKARVDYLWDGNISNELEDIQKQINQVINDDLVVEKGYLDSENEIRYWKLPGFNTVQCCGTHIKSTSELAYVKLKRKGCGAGKERIEVTTIK